MIQQISRVAFRKPIVCYCEKEWSYQIPKGHNIFVSDGQKVVDGQLLASGLIPSKIVHINLDELYQKYGVSRLRKLIKKEEGEVVQTGEIILSGLVGQEKVVVKSPIDGVFSLKRIEKGLLTVTGHLVEREVKSPDDGVVRISNGTIKILTKGYISKCIAGGFTHPEEAYLEGKWYFVEDLNTTKRGEVEGKIVWTNIGIIPAEVEKLCALGAKAIVTPSIVVEQWSDIVHLFKTATQWLVWYGFGECQLLSEQFRELSQWNGTRVICDKNENVISFPNEKGKRLKYKGKRLGLAPISVGSRIVVVGADNIEIGKLVKFGEEGFKIEIGKKEKQACGNAFFTV